MFILTPSQDSYLHERAKFYANNLRPLLEKSQNCILNDGTSKKDNIDDILYKVEWTAYRSASMTFEELGVWDTVPLNNILERVSKEIVLEYLKR